MRVSHRIADSASLLAALRQRAPESPPVTRPVVPVEGVTPTNEKPQGTNN
jgi:hypothetical protein